MRRRRSTIFLFGAGGCVSAIDTFGRVTMRGVRPFSRTKRKAAVGQPDFRKMTQSRRPSSELCYFSYCSSETFSSQSTVFSVEGFGDRDMGHGAYSAFVAAAYCRANARAL
jgi:hypothetical protein